MNQVRWQEIAWGGSEYALSVALRHTLLRAPLGLHFTKEALDAEKDSIHLAGFDPSGAVCACLVLRPSDRPSWIDASLETKPPTKPARSLSMPRPTIFGKWPYVKTCRAWAWVAH